MRKDCAGEPQLVNYAMLVADAEDPEAQPAPEHSPPTED